MTAESEGVRMIDNVIFKRYRTAGKRRFETRFAPVI
jgi:hypothetical protein